MSSVNISELKAKLSSYIRRVRSGETLLVFDRHTLVARLVPAERSEILQVRAPKNASASIPHKGRVRLRSNRDVVSVLREDRDKR